MSLSLRYSGFETDPALRKIFNGRSPEQIVESADVKRMRDVLNAEFGTSS
jgi:hypothetical protein